MLIVLTCLPLSSCQETGSGAEEVACQGQDSSCQETGSGLETNACQGESSCQETIPGAEKEACQGQDVDTRDVERCLLQGESGGLKL